MYLDLRLRSYTEILFFIFVKRHFTKMAHSYPAWIAHLVAHWLGSSSLGGQQFESRQGTYANP